MQHFVGEDRNRDKTKLKYILPFIRLTEKHMQLTSVCSKWGRRNYNELL